MSPQDEKIIDDSTSSHHDADGTTIFQKSPQESGSNTDEEGVNGTLETIAGLMGK